MAHFAKLDADNKVIHVCVVDNEVLVDTDGSESEQKGIEYLTEIFGYSKWKQTSYNGNFRKNYAGLDFKFDERLNAFIPPQPYPSWTLDENICQWFAPVAYPTDGAAYVWDESIVNWKKTGDYPV
jgi:hypothetical protein